MAADDETSLDDDGWSITSTAGSCSTDSSEDITADHIDSDYTACAWSVVAIAAAAVAVHYALGIRRSST